MALGTLQQKLLHYLAQEHNHARPPLSVLERDLGAQKQSISRSLRSLRKMGLLNEHDLPKNRPDGGSTTQSPSVPVTPEP